MELERDESPSAPQGPKRCLPASRGNSYGSVRGIPEMVVLEGKLYTGFRSDDCNWKNLKQSLCEHVELNQKAGKVRQLESCLCAIGRKVLISS